MDRTVEKITDEIIHVSYPAASVSSAGLYDLVPIDFEWNGNCVASQTEVCFSPITVYRYEKGSDGLKKKMTANGEVSYSESIRAVPSDSAYSIKLSFQIGKEEMLTGLGQYEDGIMDFRGRTEYLYESNMRIAIPFLVTTGHYGILIDSESCMIFSSAEDTVTFTIDCGRSLSYYVFLSDDIKGLIRCYHEISGMPSMLPRWAFGYIQSRERYRTGKELEDTAKRFRDEDIPIDCIVQDWYSWREGLWGEKRFDRDRYPDLAATVRRLHDDNIRFMVSIWPNMSPDSENYREFAEAGKLLPNSNLYDAFSEDARSIYWRQACEEIMESGTDALWCDNAEPFSDADWSGSTKKPERDRYLAVTDESKRSMDWERINSYGLYHAKGIYENWRKTYPKNRPVNLTRSGYTGIQGYGAILWSGDITATYDTLRRQITEGIRMSLAGIPYWTLDIGGFFVVNDKYENRGCNDTGKEPLWFWKGDYNDGVLDMGYRELYVRWLEFGTFLPIFRSHGTDTPREPWNFGNPGDPFYDAIVTHIRLRYKLIPYLYSLGAAAHFRGEMIMRSLITEYPDDEQVYKTEDEYMLGPALLIAPVYVPMYYLPGSVKIEDVPKSRKVYLPKGNGWYDLHTGTFYEGGRWTDADAPIDRIPVFVREGSVLPLSDDISFTDEKEGRADRIRVYEGCDGRFMLYHDEGDGYGFEDGKCSFTELVYSESDRSLFVSGNGGFAKAGFTEEHIRKQNA
ncbi:MAG: glycoside hydrolase [Lachnospiraceae bacterium]|nr:glycoside hydrolase [Lachnospiraceae bacterium]